MFLHWLLLLSVCVAATMSPGPAFLVTLRNSLAHTRKVGICTAIGLGFGLILPLSFTIFGITALLAQSHFAFVAVRVVGAGYLLYLGWKSLSEKDGGSLDAERPAPPQLSAGEAFRQGVLTNMTNPKGWLYFIALFSQFIGPETPMPIKLLYGATSFSVEIIWFSIVAVVLNVPHIKALFARFMAIIKKICGVLFIGLGVRLLFSQAVHP